MHGSRCRASDQAREFVVVADIIRYRQRRPHGYRTTDGCGSRGGASKRYPGGAAVAVGHIVVHYVDDAALEDDGVGAGVGEFDEEIFDEVFDLLGLGELDRDLLQRLSGGVRQHAMGGNVVLLGNGGAVGSPKHEIFVAMAGVSQVTEFYELAVIPDRYGFTSLTLIRSRNTQSNDISTALRVSHKEHEGYEHVSFLDEDEISPLERALHYMSQNRAKLESKAQTYTEITYRSRGGFFAGLYVKGRMEGHESGEYMQVGNQSVFMHSLDELAKAVDQALFKLETLRGTAGG